MKGVNNMLKRYKSKGIKISSIVNKLRNIKRKAAVKRRIILTPGKAAIA